MSRCLSRRAADDNVEKSVRDSGQPIDYFEALAVNANAGSLLTPVCNPQNILLWGRSGLTLLEWRANGAACRQMMPDVTAPVLVLFSG